jgi:pSer/pThr/pTyr-binding forkhead associated (FHA) protein
VARLRIVGTDGIERVVEIDEPRILIGRGRDNHIVLQDAQKGVSRVHAELRHENGRYVVVDLQSQNGTYVNGRRVDRADVPAGAELAIGAYRLTLSSEQTVPARTAVLLPQSDPLDHIRPAQRYGAPAADAANDSRLPRSIVAAGVAVVVVTGAVAFVWFSGGRHRAGGASAAAPGPSTATASNGSAAAPAAGAAEPADAPTDVPPKRSAEHAGVEVPRPSDAPRVTRRPGESTEAWRNRAAALQTRYGYSKAALERGDFAAAAGGFEAILIEEPGFLDAPRLLVQAQSGLHAGARRLYEAGRKLDDAGDWMGALQKYEQARQVYAGIPGLTESMARVRQQLRGAGTAAFKQARELEGNGRPQEALKEYEKAVQWLAPEDPNWHLARARIQQLKRN